MLRCTQVQCPRLKLEPLTVRFSAGQHWALLGPNGSGKTTLLHTLAGLLPCQGEIRIGDTPLLQLNAMQRAREVALLLQEHGQRFPWRVSEYLQVAASPLGQPPCHIDQARDILRILELEDLLHRRVDHLSGGQWQRVQIAAVLLQDSPIYLLDEPLNHLDPRHQQQLMQLLEQYRLKGGLILSSMHDINQAFGRCTHALLFYPDRLLAGTAAEVMQAEPLSRLYGLPLEKLSAQGREWLLPADLPANDTVSGH